MKLKIIFPVLALSCIALGGCATNGGRTYQTADSGSSNLDEAARANNNSLLPASVYESNHLLDD